MIEIKLEDAVNEEFGLEGFTDPKMLTPPQMAKLDGGQEFVSKWAYKPDKGLTLAALSDKRTEVRPNIERLRGPIKTG